MKFVSVFLTKSSLFVLIVFFLNLPLTFGSDISDSEAIVPEKGSTPSNDLLSSARTIFVSTDSPSSRFFSSQFASAETGEPDHNPDTVENDASSSVWFRLLAQNSGEVEVVVFSDEFDPVVAVYTSDASGTPTMGSLTQVTANDNSSTYSGNTSQIKFDQISGERYYLAVDSSGLAGGGQFSLMSGEPATPVTISGDVLVPELRPADTQVAVELCTSQTCYPSIDLTIDSMQPSESYEFVVPDSQRWAISYNCIGCASDLLEEGFYSQGSANTTAWTEQFISRLLLSENLEQADMTLIESENLPITFTVPSPLVSSYFFSLQLCQNTSSNTGCIYVSDTLNDTDLTYNFDIPVPKGELWTIRFDCNGCRSPYLAVGYFTADGSTANLANAGFVSPENLSAPVMISPILGSVISGEVRLPEISTNDLQFYISAGRDFDDAFRVGFNAEESITIPAGSLSANYSLAVPSIAEWLVQMDVSNCGAPFYCDENIYYASDSPDTSTTSRSNATRIFAFENISDINLSPKLATTVGGTIILPTVLDNETSASIQLCQSSDRDDCDRLGDNISIDIPANTLTVPFTIEAPTNFSGYLEVYCQSNECREKRIISPAYNIEGQSNQSSWNISLATPVNRYDDQNNITIAFAEGHFISGSISLPSPFVAIESNDNLALVEENAEKGEPASLGLRMNVDACHATLPICFDDEGDSPTIPVDGNTADYEVLVPANQTVKINYYCNSCDTGREIESQGDQLEAYRPLLPRGYYNENAANTTDWNRTTATVIVSDADQENFDLTVIKGHAITGTLSFPSGGTTTASREYNVFAIHSETGVFQSTRVSLRTSEPSAEFEIRVAPESASDSYYLGFVEDFDVFDFDDTNSNQTFFTAGFYNSGSTTARRAEAQTINYGSSLSDMDMQVRRGMFLESTLNLPEGEVAKNSIRTLIIADSNQAGSVPVTIPTLESFNRDNEEDDINSLRNFLNPTNAGEVNFQMVSLLAGENSVPFKLFIDEDQGINWTKGGDFIEGEVPWRLYYGCEKSKCNDFALAGFASNQLDNEGAAITKPSSTDARLYSGLNNTSGLLARLEYVKDDEFCFPIIVSSNKIATICM